MLLKLWGRVFSTGYNACLSKSKRMLLGWAEMLPSLRHIWPHFLHYGQCIRILPVSPVLTHRAWFGFYGHNMSLASHETFYEA